MIGADQLLLKQIQFTNFGTILIVKLVLFIKKSKIFAVHHKMTNHKMWLISMHVSRSKYLNGSFLFVISIFKKVADDEINSPYIFFPKLNNYSGKMKFIHIEKFRELVVNARQKNFKIHPNII